MAPTPNVAEIPLPPGITTLQQYLTLQGQLINIAFTIVVAFSVVLWDYCTQLPNEIALYRSEDKRIWRQPVTWLFITLRYSGLVATFTALFFVVLQSRHCQFVVSFSSAAAVLVVISSGGIFYYRVIAIWNRNKIVMGVVGFFYVVMVGSWIAVATQFRAITGPATPYLSNCQISDIKAWAPLSYGSSVAFDTVVLAFTVSKLRGHLSTSATKSKTVANQIYQDNLGYFLVTAVANLTALSFQCLGPQYALLKPTAVPFSTIMTVAMGSRVFLNLKLFDQREHRTPTNTSHLSNVGDNRYIATSHSLTALDHVRVDIKKSYKVEEGLNYGRPSTSGDGI